MIAQMRARDSKEWKQQESLREDGDVMADEEIIAKWARNGVVQRLRGTLLHFHCEAFFECFRVCACVCRIFGSGGVF